jgi:hypothetical protein
MRYSRRLLRWTGVLIGTLIVLTGCTYDAALQRLSLAEQAEFHTYSKAMTGIQEHIYLSKASAAERRAYLRQIGLAQRFEALDPQDREAVLSGIPRVGMSAEALLFVWGSPYYTAGDARHYAHWHYLGSSFALATAGNQYRNSNNRVDVYLVNGHVVGWVDYPAINDLDGSNDDNRRQ